LAPERVRADEARAPSLRRFEVRNTLIVYERRERLRGSGAAALAPALTRLNATADRSPDAPSF